MSKEAESDLDWLLRQVVELCEHTEVKMAELLEVKPENLHERGFYRGQAFEAKRIRQAISEVARIRAEDTKGQS
jgi:ribosomal protein S18 acetylase RimI-like enzyme